MNMDVSSLKRKNENEMEVGGSKKMKVENNEEHSEMSDENTIKVGSRKSELALIQTRTIISLLKEFEPDMDFPIETMQTLGDSILHLSLPKIGEKGLFTKDLEIALSEKRVDFLVHSLKDLPTKMPEGMAIGTVIERDNPYDCVIFHSKHKVKTLAELPANSVIGTSSLRRVAQLKKRFPHLTFKSVRGNLNTRSRKLEEEGSVFDALVLAKAGIDRMGWSDRIGQILDEDILYAVSQGAIAVEIRDNDKRMMELLGKLTHMQTLLTVTAERAFMRKLDGGCSTPVGCRATYADGKLSLRGNCLTVDGTQCVEAELSTDIQFDLPRNGDDNEVTYMLSDMGVCFDKRYEEEYDKASKLGEDLALELIDMGAEEILRIVKKGLPQVSNIQLPVKATTML